VHFLCLEPRETDKNVLKFTKNLVLNTKSVAESVAVLNTRKYENQKTNHTVRANCKLRGFFCDTV